MSKDWLSAHHDRSKPFECFDGRSSRVSLTLELGMLAPPCRAKTSVATAARRGVSLGLTQGKATTTLSGVGRSSGDSPEIHHRATGVVNTPDTLA